MRRSTFAPPARWARLSACLLALAACDSPTEAPTVDAVVQFGKGGKKGVGVETAIPAMAEQEVTLDVRVLGSGFDNGSQARWLRGGEASSDVTTNSTTFVSPSELIANITIDVAAATELYDIEVTTARGKKGVGVELFTVLEKGGGNPPNEPATIELGGAIVTAGPQEGMYNPGRKKDEIGAGSVNCPAGEADGYDQCFDASLHYGAGIVGGQASCTPDPADMPVAWQNELYARLSDPMQKRWSFEGDIDNKGGKKGHFRVFWYEDGTSWGDGQRFSLLHFDSTAPRTGATQWQATGGTLTLYADGQNANLQCAYSGTLDVTVYP